MIYVEEAPPPFSFFLPYYFIFSFFLPRYYYYAFSLSRLAFCFLRYKIWWYDAAAAILLFFAYAAAMLRRRWYRDIFAMLSRYYYIKILLLLLIKFFFFGAIYAAFYAACWKIRHKTYIGAAICAAEMILLFSSLWRKERFSLRAILLYFPPFSILYITLFFFIFEPPPRPPSRPSSRHIMSFSQIFVLIRYIIKIWYYAFSIFHYAHIIISPFYLHAAARYIFITRYYYIWYYFHAYIILFL